MAEIGQAENPFADVVRKTKPLTAEQQLKTFHVPAGFEIELVASEPEIGKPMNMAFDAKGRLWLTQSREYPYPVPLDKKGRDKIMVLENFGPNGHAQKITPFAEGLNIPIGIYPYKNGCIAFSIPHMYFFDDTNGDGKADTEEIVLSRFGYEKDTHGMTGAFRRGYDGWLYADHGFNNDSTLKAKDGSEIKVNSGNVYRVRVDGSRVEQYSWGQVNPFGLMFDHLGDLWSTDCHSSPVYQLLRGAYYPSFGKPHDGLGYGPNICEHSHGSTAIAGMVFYAATNYPPEYHNNTFIGNVMTCRINRDSYIQHGSTRVAKEEPDFVVCDDPWFRPVDVQLGPDGALYIADFYNRVIGHYEVPLDHPGRDRERGRIWRVVYKGVGHPTRTAKPFNVAKASASDIVEQLGNANLACRLLAMNELVDRVGKSAVKPLERMMKNRKSTGLQKAHGLWALARLGALDDKVLVAAAKDADGETRLHSMRVLGEMETWSTAHRALALAGLKDANAHVQRAAAEAVGRHPAFDHIHPLLDLRARVGKNDRQLLHMTRMALRNQLAAGDHFLRLLPMNLSEEHSRFIADVALGVKTTESGQFVLRHVQWFTEDRPKLSEFLRHAARYAPEGQMAELSRFTRASFGNDLDFQLALFRSVQEGTQQRGGTLTTNVSDWGAALAEQLLASVDPTTLDWRNSPFKGQDTTNPWTLEERQCADGKKTRVISSLAPGGEKFTGILRSKTFTLPEKLEFYLCGHDGSPEKPPRNKNAVRLRSADGKKVLKEVSPPRNDTAQLISWDLKKFAGEKGFLEIVDGNTGSSYAWLGVGRIKPEVVPMPKVIPNQVDKRQLTGAEIAESFRLTKLEPKLSRLLTTEDADSDARAAAAKALVAINGPAHLAALARIVRNAEEPGKLREKCAQALAQIGSTEARTALLDSLVGASQALQPQIAMALASSADGAETLLAAAEKGKVSAHVLQDTKLKDRVVAAKPANAAERLEKLTRDLAPISEEKQKLIDARRASFKSDEVSVENGLQIYTVSCAVCHQLDGKGALVGPQLDGIGIRGADRLMEDILDPNRNVDHAFHYSNVTLKDDSVVSGLFRREEGEMLVFIDGTGKEVSIPKKDVVERKESHNSLMPDNFGEMITEKDFNDLIAFLLSKGGIPAAK